MRAQKPNVNLGHLDHSSDIMRVPVVGTSMDPMLRERDILIVNLSPIEEVKCGDLIVHGEQELITHRVLINQNKQIYTKGDARYWIDPILSIDDVWGVVKQIERNGLIANMESGRWQVINRMIGYWGRFQAYLAWPEQIKEKSRARILWWHRTNFWLSKRINWFILFILAWKWLRRKPLRMDNKC